LRFGSRGGRGVVGGAMSAWWIRSERTIGDAGW